MSSFVKKIKGSWNKISPILPSIMFIFSLMILPALGSVRERLSRITNQAGKSIFSTASPSFTFTVTIVSLNVLSDEFLLVLRTGTSHVKQVTRISYSILIFCLLPYFVSPTYAPNVY